MDLAAKAVPVQASAVPVSASSVLPMNHVGGFSVKREVHHQSTLSPNTSNTISLTS